MKGLIVSTSLFLILIVGIIANSIYANSVHDDMHEMVSKISHTPCTENTQIIEEIKEYWEHNKSILSISVSFDYIDDLTNKLDAVQQANHSLDKTQLAINIELLQNSIDAIIRLENIKIENIL